MAIIFPIATITHCRACKTPIQHPRCEKVMLDASREFLLHDFCVQRYQEEAHKKFLEHFDMSCFKTAESLGRMQRQLLQAYDEQPAIGLGEFKCIMSDAGACSTAAAAVFYPRGHMLPNIGTALARMNGFLVWKGLYCLRITWDPDVLSRERVAEITGTYRGFNKSPFYRHMFWAGDRKNPAIDVVVCSVLSECPRFQAIHAKELEDQFRKDLMKGQEVVVTKGAVRFVQQETSLDNSTVTCFNTQVADGKTPLWMYTTSSGTFGRLDPEHQKGPGTIWPFIVCMVDRILDIPGIDVPDKIIMEADDSREDQDGPE